MIECPLLKKCKEDGISDKKRKEVKKMKKRTLALLMAGTMVMGLTACGGAASSSTAASGDKAASDATSSAASTVASAAASTATDGAKIKIGYSYPSANNEFWGTNTVNCVKQAAEACGFDVVIDDCNYDQAEQVTDVESMISMGIDALVLAPQDASVCAGITASCKSAGIPVVIIDRWPGDDLKAGDDYVCFIGPDDEKAGYDIAMSLIDAGCKKLIGMGGTEGTSVAEGRHAGFEKALEEHPEVQMVQYEWVGDSMDDGDAGFRNISQAQSDFDGVWCYNDSLALATVNVLKEESKISEVKVAGMDLLSPSIESMQAKELWSSTGGHYMQAGFAAIIAYDVANGIAYDGDAEVRLSLLSANQDTVGAFVEQYVNSDEVFDWASVCKTLNPDNKYDFTLTLK